MSQTLNWGLLSTARINRRIIGPIREAKRSNLVAVASRSAETAQSFATEWGIERVFDSYEAMLASPDINAVYIPLPNNLHCQWAVKAAEAGKHILCEKPLALTPIEVDLMLNAANENNVVLIEAFMYRMHPQLAKVQELISEGLIGPVKLIRAKFSFTLGDRPNYRQRPEMGGGSLWDIGCYPVSFAQAVAGANPVEVFAWQETNSNGIDLSMAGQLKYANGIMAQIDCSFAMPYRVGAEVVGEKGTLYIPNPWQPGVDGKASGIIYIAPDDTQTPIAIADKDPYLCEIEVMEQAVLDDTPVPYVIAHSRGNIATINALYQSAASGKAVKL